MCLSILYSSTEEQINRTTEEERWGSISQGREKCWNGLYSGPAIHKWLACPLSWRKDETFPCWGEQEGKQELVMGTFISTRKLVRNFQFCEEMVSIYGGRIFSYLQSNAPYGIQHTQIQTGWLQIQLTGLSNNLWTSCIPLGNSSLSGCCLWFLDAVCAVCSGSSPFLHVLYQVCIILTLTLHLILRRNAKN